MTDEQLDRAVRDADPYRPHYAQSLDGAEQTLLEEIMSVPTAVRRVLTRRLAIAVAAAAVIGVVATTLIGHHPDDRQAAGTASDPTATVPSKSATRFSPVALKAAEQNPRLLIGESGWKVATVYGFAANTGTVVLTKGSLHLEMNWYPGDQYDSYYQDRSTEVSPPSAVRIGDWPGSLFKYSATRFAVMLRPRDGVFVEFGTASNGWTRAEFDRVRALIRQVDVTTWLDAMPPEIVTPPKADQAAAKVLADIPLPPGFDAGSLADLGTNDQYQFGVQVTGRVGCAWIAEWKRADQAGDQAAKSKAAAALRSSHNWKALKQIAPQGGWSSIFWDVADQTAAGQVPQGYESTLGCA
jgi:hypothetical protein